MKKLGKDELITVQANVQCSRYLYVQEKLDGPTCLVGHQFWGGKKKSPILIFKFPMFSLHVPSSSHLAQTLPPIVTAASPRRRCGRHTRAAGLLHLARAALRGLLDPLLEPQVVEKMVLDYTGHHKMMKEIMKIKWGKKNVNLLTCLLKGVLG